MSIRGGSTQGQQRRRARSILEPIMDSHIPYTAHVMPELVVTDQGDYVQTIRLEGISHDTADLGAIARYREQLNVLWRSIASPHIALWMHVIRRRVSETPRATSGPRFAQQLDSRYRTKINAQRLLLNELYLSVVYRPSAGLTQGLAAKLISRRDRQQQATFERADSLDACAKLQATLLAALADYQPIALGVYQRDSIPHSTLLEFLGLLINGSWQPMPLPRTSIAHMLGTTRPVFGIEAMEYRSATQTRLAAFVGIKEYPAATTATMFDALLRAPCEFVLTHSFTFLSAVVAQNVLQRKYRQLLSSGDFAASQAEELRVALDAHASGEFAMGDHHASLQILSEAYSGSEDGAGYHRIKQLNDQLAEVLPLLQASHLILAREDLALEAAYWGQLPGRFGDRVRKATITSRNVASFAPLHSFPAGRSHGNHWGDALCVLATSARTPYYFSLHASGVSTAQEDTASDNGHTVILGPTGAGKTVFIGFLIARVAAIGATQVVIDKDRGLELLVRALDGEYLPIRAGEPTGCNPLQLPETPSNMEFLRQWLALLVQPQTARDVIDLADALRGAMRLPPQDRRLSRLIEFLDATEPDGVWARLSRWCASLHGDLAWVFDNECDALVARLGGPALFGIDVTELLANPLVRTPLAAYLLHLISGLLDGRRLVCWMEEFSSLLDAPVFEGFASNGLLTWRKLNGALVLSAQSPNHVITSRIARTLIEQVSSRVYFPNPLGAHEDYVNGFGLSAREFELITQLMTSGAREFLVKQGRGSAVCTLDLQGCHEELNVLSGRATTLRLMHECIERGGERSDVWLPMFFGAIRTAAEQKGERA